MAYVYPAGPNATPYYPSGPLPVGPAALPAAAKTALADTSNAVQVLAAMANNVQEVDQLVVEVTAALSSAGKLTAFLYDGTTAREVASIAHANLAVSTTVAGKIDFGLSATNPIIVPAGSSLWIATAVAQPAGALVATGNGKVW